MHREPDVGFDPGSPGSRPGSKAGAKPLRHPGIPKCLFYIFLELGLERVAVSDLRIEVKEEGSLGGAAVWRLPLAQGAILETPDRIPRQAPGAWSLLLSLPVSLPLSLSATIINK